MLSAKEKKDTVTAIVLVVIGFALGFVGLLFVGPFVFHVIFGIKAPYEPNLLLLASEAGAIVLCRFLLLDKPETDTKLKKKKVTAAWVSLVIMLSLILFSIVLLGRWPHTVHFSVNGGTPLSSSVSSKQVISGEAYGTLPTPSRDGYDFDGWWYNALSSDDPEAGRKITSQSIVPGGFIRTDEDFTLYPEFRC